MKREFRKVLPLALSVSLIVNSMAGFPVFAASDESEYEQEFSMTLDDICDALEEAMEEGDLPDESKYHFSGAAAEEYEELFEQNDMLYEITPAFKEDGDGDLTLKIFARLDDDQELENITATEDTKFIFLLLNKTDEEQSANIWVDDGETGWITVVPAYEVDAEGVEDVQDEEIVTLNVLDAGQDEAAEPEEEEDLADDEENDDETIEDENVSADEESISEESIAEKSEQEEEFDDEENEISEDGSPEEDSSEEEADDTSEDKNDSDDVEDDNSENEKDDSGEDPSENKDPSGKEEKESSEKDSSKGSSDQDKQESVNENSESDTKDTDETSDSESKDAPEKEVAFSANNVNRLTASLGKSDDEEDQDNEEAILASASDADSEGYEINGEVYDAVIVNDKQSGVVFVTTLADLGMDYGIQMFTTSLQCSVSTESDLKTRLESTSYDTVTVTMNNDITITANSSSGAYLEIKKNKVLDLNGHTLYVNDTTSNGIGSGIFQLCDSEISFTIKDSSTNKEGKVCGGTEDNPTPAKSPLITTKSGNAYSNNNIILQYITITNFAKTTTSSNSADYLISLMNGANLEIDSCKISDNTCRVIYASTTAGTMELTDSVFDKNGVDETSLQSVLVALGGKSVTIKNCEFTDNLGSAVFIEDVPDVSITNSEFSGNKKLNDINAANSSGGAIYLRNIGSNTNEIEISSNVFKNNQTRYYGGAVYLSTLSGTVKFTGNELNGNTGYGRGGGAYISFLDNSSGPEFTFNSNEFNENTVKAKITSDDNEDSDTEENDSSGNIYGDSMGGGLYFLDMAGSHTQDHYDFSGNEFIKNKADETCGYGGGLYLDEYDPDCEILFDSGTISGNSAWWGAGIAARDDSIQNTTIHINNAVITGNTASRGGGIWAQSASNLKLYDTNGAAVYKNTASGILTYDEKSYDPSGDDIRLDGYGSDLSGSQAFIRAYISPRALGGIWNDWYSDDIGARYSDGTRELVDMVKDDVELINYNAIGLHSELSDEGIALAKTEEKVSITDNISTGVGGGIAYSGTLIFGDKKFKTLNINKIWKDEFGNELSDDEIPVDAIDFNVERVNDDQTVDLEIFTLTADADWEGSIEHLPFGYTYELTEDEIRFYKPSYEITENNIKVTNTHQEEITIEGKKVWEDSDNADGIRPGSITLTLYKGENEEVESLTVSKPEEGGNEWPWSFVEEKYDDEDSKISYWVKESEVFGYETVITGDMNSGFIITNTETVKFSPVDTEIVPDEADQDSWTPSTSAMIGEEIEFELGTHIPILPGLDGDTEESEYSYSMRFHEVLTDGLNLNEEKPYHISLTTGDKTYNIVDYSSFTDDCGDGCTFEVTVNLNKVVDFMNSVDTTNEGTGIDPLNALGEGNIAFLNVTEEELSEATINIFFYAFLDDDVEPGTYASTAWYEVLNGEESFYISESSIATISTYELSIFAADSDNEAEGIGGVVAGLYYDEECTQPVTRNGEPLTATSDSDGILNFSGLATGTYYVKQLEVPEGYELSEKAIETIISGSGTFTVDAVMFVTAQSDIQTGPGPAEAGSLDITVTDKNGSNISGVVFEIFDSEGNSMGSYTSGSSGINISGLAVGTYTIRIINANGYTFPQSEYTFTVNDGESTTCNIQATNTKTTSGRRSSGGGGGGGSSGGSTLSLTASTGTWIFDGLLFVESDGTIPSNEYLIIDGEIYAFYTNGYAIDRSHTQYYTEEAIADQIYIPTATGTWYKCGWWYSYADGTYPHNGWAKLSYNGRSDWYYFDVDGWMVTGWLDWNGNTYYLHTEEDGTRGHMVTGWNLIDGIWYYFSEDGALQRNSQTSDENIANIYGLG